MTTQYDEAGRVAAEETVEGTPTQWRYGYDAEGG
jgi:YD repeat-containing protein